MTVAASTMRVAHLGAVDELARNRHVHRAGAPVESASRAAGGFPTLGGGVRWGLALDARDSAVAATAAAGAAESPASPVGTPVGRRG